VVVVLVVVLEVAVRVVTGVPRSARFLEAGQALSLRLC